MKTPLFPKTPMQIRREAERAAMPRRRQVEPGPVDPANYPRLADEGPRDTDAATEWLAHLAAGRIEVR